MQEANRPYMTEDKCDLIQKASRALIIAEVRDLMAGISRPVEKLDALVQSLDARVKELDELFDRVRAIEMWKADHEGRMGHKTISEKVGERSVADIRRFITSTIQESDGKILAEIKTRKGDGTGNGSLTIPKWAVYMSIPLFILILIIAAMAGEEMLPYILRVPIPK